MLTIIKKNKVLVHSIVLVLLFGVALMASNLISGTQTSMTGKKFLIADNVFYNNVSVVSIGIDSGFATLVKQVSPDTMQVAKYDFSTNQTSYISSQTSKPAFSYSGENHLSDSFVVWKDFRNFADNNSKSDIYATNLATGQESRITPEREQRENLTLYKNYIAYAENDSSNPGIYLKNLSSTEVPLKIHTFTSNQNPFISIDEYNNEIYVVYENMNNDKYDINVYNVNAKVTTTITSSKFIEKNPVFQSGDIYFIEVEADESSSDLWKSAFKEKGSLKTYSIKSKQLSTIMAFDAGEVIWPIRNSSNSNHFIFLKTTSSAKKLYGYNPKSSITAEVISDKGSSQEIILVQDCCYGDILVFSKSDTSDDSDVYMYDFSNNQTTVLSNSPSIIEQFPRINGNKIVWTEFLPRKSESDPVPFLKVYGYIIP